ncbi:MAG: HupE/UreJ family protein [Gammaproteobacteria bacterium]|jgi:hydrogenase/urease accessory protein HupE
MKLRLLLILCLSLGLLDAAQADIVKPALVEISANTKGEVNIEVRASIEALLTGINARYKNTQDAPTAEEYDELRVLQADQLAIEFEPFKQEFLDQIFLKVDGTPVTLEIVDITIPEPGYTKVPRISVINLRGDIDQSATSLQWYYPASFGDNAVRVRQVDEDNELWHWSEWQWLRKDEASEPFSLEEVFTQRPIAEVVLSYVFIGFEHIVPKGTDHILFIIGIFLLSTRMKPLLWQVTMFTVAHTLTLALSMKGYINLPANIVEPLIALSIAYVGIENIFAHSLHKSRLVLVFLFGLLHGMGFAGVLAEFGMPPNAFATALISFNVGVELGQIAVIILMYLLVGLWFRAKPWYHQRITVPASLIISVTGLYWTWDRIVF